MYCCWLPSGASLRSRAGKIASFVNNSRFVYVNGFAPKPRSFVVGSFYRLETLLFYAQARCLSVGRSLRAGRMTSFCNNS